MPAGHQSLASAQEAIPVRRWGDARRIGRLVAIRSRLFSPRSGNRIWPQAAGWGLVPSRRSASPSWDFDGPLGTRDESARVIIYDLIDPLGGKRRTLVLLVARKPRQAARP